MKIYLAGSCSTENRTMMTTIARALREYGNLEVYCPWELKIENAWDMCQENWARRVFEEDIAAIKECEIFLMISEGRISSAGTNWEQGFAYALNKIIIVLQINDTPTSLMTFSSATKFINCTKDNLYGVIRKICDAASTDIFNLYRMSSNNYTCLTTLT